MANINPVPGDVDQVKADPKRPWKAIVGAVVAFIAIMWANLDGKQDNLGAITTNEWIGIVVTTVLTFAAVYGVKNPKVLDR